MSSPRKETEMAFEKIDESFKLVQGMADRLGIPLEERLALHPDTEVRRLREMVMRCSHCDCQEACGKLQSDNDVLGRAPAYCRNEWK